MNDYIRADLRNRYVAPSSYVFAACPTSCACSNTGAVEGLSMQLFSEHKGRCRSTTTLPSAVGVTNTGT